MAKKGMGLIMFRQNKATIAELRHKGYDKRRVYSALGDKIDISYVQFTRIWNKEFNEIKSLQNNKLNYEKKSKCKALQSNTMQNDRLRRAAPLIHDPHMTPERLKDLIG